MKDLCDRTGLPRQVIHFYILQGLLPEGEKTGRNMAYYSEAHLDVSGLFASWQHERFLPLRIEVLGEKQDGFQQATAAARPRREASPQPEYRPSTGGRRRARAAPAAPAPRGRRPRGTRQGWPPQGMLAIVKRRGNSVAREDVWLIELWGELRAALRFSKALGFVRRTRRSPSRSKGMFEKKRCS